MAIRSFFVLMRKSNRVFEKYCEEVVRQWNLNNTSFQVIMFFADNPKYNSARDLCRMLELKTGIASVAIEQLVREGLLRRETDLIDRRMQRLYLTEKAEPLVEAGRNIRRYFFDCFRQAMTPEEFDTYLSLTMKLRSAVDEMDKNISK